MARNRFAPEIESSKGNPAELAQVAQLASIFHENWRASRRREDGSFEPRVKKTTDKAWLKARGIKQREGEVDIANTSYNELPRECQKENRLAAEAALRIVRENPTEDVERLAHRVHVQWLKRNGKWAPDSQKVSYPKLSEADKEEDRKHVYAAKKVLSVK
jgi:hypothetical protein